VLFAPFFQKYWHDTSAGLDCCSFFFYGRLWLFGEEEGDVSVSYILLLVEFAFFY